MAIRWTPLLATGVTSLDTQHRAIFELANRLLEAMSDGAPPAAVAALVHELAALADGHFAFEEAVMARAGYPHVDDHRAAHAALRCELAGLLGEHDGSHLSPLLAAQTNRFVCDWLLRHIPSEDLELGSWHARQRAARAVAG